MRKTAENQVGTRGPRDFKLDTGPILQILYVTGTSSRPILRHDEIVRQPVGSMARNLT